MKRIQKAGMIIHKLMQEHKYYPLKKMFFAKDFLNLLNVSHQRLISKLFIKNQSLYILTKSHIGYQELNHDDTRKSIKMLIKLYAKNNTSSGFEQIKELKIFTDRYVLSKKQEKKNTK